MCAQKKVLVLGATGSIGTSTLDIIRNQSDRFVCCGLTAHHDKAGLARLAAECGAPFSLTADDGTDGIKRLIERTKPDIVVNGIAGSAGLVPSQLVLEAGVDLALANKETIVMAAPLMLALAEKHQCQILPVDSEHSAIFALLRQCGRENVEKLIITASGGPFRTWSSERIRHATVADALKHPTWNMGKKITVDSATMGNKGLEVIEAQRLFGFSADDIQVVVHPQSIVHSLVRTTDGIVYAQCSEPDMKHPIMQALDYPNVNANFMRPFDLTDTADGTRTLTFEKPRYDDFPLLRLAFDAARKDAAYPIAFNAADEIAAQAFIDGSIGFTDIARVTESVMRHDWSGAVRDMQDVFSADSEARAHARAAL